jgi:ThiF family
MSHQLIERSSDLKRLQDDGFHVEVRSGHLVIQSIPYLNNTGQLGSGVLSAKLVLAGDVTSTPNHVAYFTGEYPCNQHGTPIEQIRHTSNREVIDDVLSADHSFSSQPQGGFKNYYEMMTTYITIISGPAELVHPTVTARTFPVLAPAETSVFKYQDTATSRAGIGAVSRKIELQKIAIVGVGGTGSYILDLVAKTPVREIHLFDGDVFLQHNGFRSPGAPSRKQLETAPKKCSYFEAIYSNMRTGIVPHEYFIDEKNVEELKGMDFVFLSMDGGEAKRVIVDKLEEYDIPFVDTGMGIQLVGDTLHGVLRVTTSTASKRDHVKGGRVSFVDTDDNNDYASNIQVAELNALSATLAVIKWKKVFGFYQDYDQEHHCTYTIDGNHLWNEEKIEV